MGSNKLSDDIFYLISGLLTSYAVFVEMITFFPISQQKMWDTETWTLGQLTLVCVLQHLDLFITGYFSSIVFLRWVSVRNPSGFCLFSGFFWVFVYECLYLEAYQELLVILRISPIRCSLLWLSSQTPLLSLASCGCINKMGQDICFDPWVSGLCPCS